MTGTRERGRAIRDYILEHVSSHPADIAQLCTTHFSISRQALNKHLGRLVADGLLIAQGATRNRQYSLAKLLKKDIVVPLINDPTKIRCGGTRSSPSCRICLGAPERSGNTASLKC